MEVEISTYTILIAKQLGLKPLSVHFDNGWNTDISVYNIKNACEKLDIESFTVIPNWVDFKNLQVTFLKSSTPNADIPANYAIYSVLYDMANKKGVKYILNVHALCVGVTFGYFWL